ncbi:MAG TPA: hypothetical protein VH164_01115 [Ktedonobacteraceae bacterium]|jgi:hypothetical protein|nr:hypothetical protein [Ktedonobacteraceae bacterium]
MVERSAGYLEKKEAVTFWLLPLFVVFVLVMLRAADSKIASPSIGKK